jgi:formate hydrogenlyase transcriptional activator
MAASPVPSILLVDDDPTNLQLLKATLKRLGAELRLAVSGEEALAQAREHRPTLVLLDVMMPGIDGFETCRQIKADPACADAAVIFLSALDDARDKVQGLSVGAVDYIAKPFQPQEVLARVQTHLTIQQLKAELAERNRQLTAANQQILESVAEGICGFDRDGRISFANPAACQLMGHPEDSLLGRLRYANGMLLGADGRSLPERATPVYASLLRGETLRSDTLLLQRRGAVPLPVALTSAPIRRGDSVLGAVLAFRDISERKRQEQALHDALAEVERLKERLAAENAYLRAEIRTDRQFGEIVGQSEALLTVLEQVRRVAPTKSSVLLQGESGTGKEAIARALHDLSPRRDHPLIKVNCGAISPSLIESELFGHEKGAFTGALRQRAGFFELADGGTIFLDEVGELPSDAQVKLLRVLQEQELSRVGSEAPIRIDVRVIAATNRDLAALVEGGSFRLDLYYRLNVFPITLPPLRERRDDIPLLAAKFLADQARALGKDLKGMTPAAVRLIQSYDWPGNIRELQNVIERAAILATGSVVDIAPSLVTSGTPHRPSRATKSVADEDPLTLAQAEAQHIRRILDRTGWAVAGPSGAARLLGVPESTLRSRMKKLGIRRKPAAGG